MARKQTPAEAGPVYEATAGVGAAVALTYPFTRGGRNVASVLLLPPSYGDLKALRLSDRVSAEDILPTMSDLTVPDVLAMRWPDVEAVMLMALTFLPGDFADMLSGSAAPVQPDVPASVDAPAPSDDKPVLSDFLVDPEEFNLNG